MDKRRLYRLSLYIGIAIISTLLLVNWLYNGGLTNCMKDMKKNIYFSNVSGVLIYSDFDAYIYSYLNDSVKIQIPVYELNNSLRNSYSIEIRNFDIGMVTDIELALKNQFKHSNQYILTFLLFPTRVGTYKLDNLKIVISSDGSSYEGNLGERIFEIDEPYDEKHLRVIGGSLFSQWLRDPIGFQHRSELLNTANQKINLKRIIINHDKIKISTTTVKDLNLNPNVELKIFTDIDVSKSSGNVLVQPKLIYSLDDKEYALPLNQTIFASLVPTEELIQLVKEKRLKR